MGIFTSMIPDDGRWYRQGYYVVHKTIGFTLFALVIARLIWNFLSPRPRLAASLAVWERLAAHGAHWALYGLMLAFPVSGFMMSTYAGKLSHWFVWDLPLPFAPDEQAIVLWALLHKIVLPFVFYFIITAHVFGALKHRYVDRDLDPFRRMVM
jgi:cytochrome b561